MLIGFLSCQKRIFGHVEVSGRVLDFFTKEPIQVAVSLMGDDATSAKTQSEATIGLATTTTTSDGKFHLKSRQSKRRNYYISIYGREKEEIKIQLNQNTNLGDFAVGVHFYTCDITIIPRSDSSISLYKGNSFDYFNSGTTTTVQHKIRITSPTFIDSISHPIWYITKSTHFPYSTTNYSKHILITPLTGPLTTTIYY